MKVKDLLFVCYMLFIAAGIYVIVWPTPELPVSREILDSVRVRDSLHVVVETLKIEVYELEKAYQKAGTASDTTGMFDDLRYLSDSLPDNRH